MRNINPKIIDSVKKLTLLYTSVLAVVALSFSVVTYRFATREIDARLRRQVVGFRSLLGRTIVDDRATDTLRQEQSEEARRVLKTNLLLLNTFVIGGGGLLSYFVAKRTMQPLEDARLRQEKFSSDASHELRTPLAVIRSEAEVALRTKSPTEQDFKNTLISIVEETEKMRVLTESLLSVSRGAEMNVELVPVETSSIIEQLKSRYPDVLTGGTKRSYTLHADRILLVRALEIVIQNAYAHGGPEVEVRIEAKSHSHRVHIDVMDTGVGISKDHQDKIFNRLYQAESSRGKGYGLGLSIAEQMVQAQDGTIRLLSSRPGKTIFRVSLPKK
jgi:two-component system, OmpR family, sensor histidine kinase CiaH